MAAFVFLLGRAGCGKSAATRHMAKYMSSQYGWDTQRLTDYEILHAMFRDDMSRNNHSRFRPIACGGFDVIDFSVLPEALSQLQTRAESFSSKENLLVTIEFARNNYQDTWNVFSHAFLQKSYFLFIDARLDICIKRVRERVNREPGNLDNHFVSDEILTGYYGRNAENNLIYMSEQFHKDFALPPSRVKIIANNGSQETEFAEKINDFLVEIIEAQRQPEPSLTSTF